ncbi:Iron-sulfur cluster assembly 2, mitochondrial [Orchesella cincta]|uniref:Iron-sulfur cluster assembly 2, mitochondrial n=1 Tax=Orchesella cincta TaxID=48709 RepID=A0A1D2MUK5_ORCCI|nr:Iron-sulfur cluster assembly 2, mitochondrial [Orchesella cincta]
MTSTVFRASRQILDLSSRKLSSFGVNGGATRQIVSLSSTSSSSSAGVNPPSSSLKGTVQVSESCKKRLKEILDEGTFLRVSVEGGGCSGFQYKFNVDKEIGTDDIVIHKDQKESSGAALVVIDEMSLDIIQAQPSIRTGTDSICVPNCQQSACRAGLFLWCQFQYENPHLNSIRMLNVNVVLCKI